MSCTKRESSKHEKAGVQGEKEEKKQRKKLQAICDRTKNCRGGDASDALLLSSLSLSLVYLFTSLHSTSR